MPQSGLLKIHTRTVTAFAVALALAICASAPSASEDDGRLQFVLTADAHYGITRAAFRGAKDVPANVVNAAEVAAINRLPGTQLPKDGGIGGLQPIGSIDFLAELGDIANREDVTDAVTIQPAAASWAQFEADYFGGVTLRSTDGRQIPIFVVPGNHDVTNAIGFYNPMRPAIDTSAMAGIYNHMMPASTPKTAATYEYPRDAVRVSRDIKGVHLIFITIWPDSVTRAWIANDLARVPATTPVFIFVHDPPDGDAKHFRNPNGAHGLDATAKFDNLLADQFADGPVSNVEPRAEQAELERFFAAHPNITAYFHGHNNWTQFYDWTGPAHTALVHTFRVDSPMKGGISALDETRLSFEMATVDLSARTMTVRECLWNAHPEAPGSALAWGASTTVALQPRPVR